MCVCRQLEEYRAQHQSASDALQQKQAEMEAELDELYSNDSGSKLQLP